MYYQVKRFKLRTFEDRIRKNGIVKVIKETIANSELSMHKHKNDYETLQGGWQNNNNNK